MNEAYDTIPTYAVEEERQDGKLWRTVVIGEQEHRINMKIIEPYMRVISHGGNANWPAAVSVQMHGRIFNCSIIIWSIFKSKGCKDSTVLLRLSYYNIATTDFPPQQGI